jgi:hypothetical protein
MTILKIARGVVATLQRMKNDQLSGDDSGLASIWDEICAQIQYEESWAWDAYEETVRQVVGVQLKKLSAYEREAVWLQTPAGEDWECKDESDRDAYPVFEDDIVEYLLTEHIYQQAANWTNRRIRKYLEALW